MPDPALVKGTDGRRRCWWGSSSAEYAAYHDHEWGRPVTGDTAIYERLCLEGFQSGLSWLTILRKREGFRAAFSGFDPDQVARYDQHDVERLLGDASIVRHRGKIEATIANARATSSVREQHGSLAALVWSYAPSRRRRAPKTMAEIEASTAESEALARTLKRHGFKFLGPTTVYAAMQAMGVVNDHITGCHVRSDVERERKAVTAAHPAG